MKLPVEVVRSGLSVSRCGGETRNLSSSGVLMTTNGRISVGDSIEFLITLLMADTGEPVRLRCMGKVVREEGSAAAATVERYEFLRG